MYYFLHRPDDKACQRSQQAEMPQMPQSWDLSGNRFFQEETTLQVTQRRAESFCEAHATVLSESKGG